MRMPHRRKNASAIAELAEQRQGPLAASATGQELFELLDIAAQIACSAPEPGSGFPATGLRYSWGRSCARAETAVHLRHQAARRRYGVADLRPQSACRKTLGQVFIDGQAVPDDQSLVDQQRLLCRSVCSASAAAEAGSGAKLSKQRQVTLRS